MSKTYEKMEATNKLGNKTDLKFMKVISFIKWLRKSLFHQNSAYVVFFLSETIYSKD